MFDSCERCLLSCYSAPRIESTCANDYTSGEGKEYTGTCYAWGTSGAGTKQALAEQHV